MYFSDFCVPALSPPFSEGDATSELQPFYFIPLTQFIEWTLCQMSFDRLSANFYVPVGSMRYPGQLILLKLSLP